MDIPRQGNARRVPWPLRHPPAKGATLGQEPERGVPKGSTAPPRSASRLAGTWARGGASSRRRARLPQDRRPAAPCLLAVQPARQELADGEAWLRFHPPDGSPVCRHVSYSCLAARRAHPMESVAGQCRPAEALSRARRWPRHSWGRFCPVAPCWKRKRPPRPPCSQWPTAMTETPRQGAEVQRRQVDGRGLPPPWRLCDVALHRHRPAQPLLVNRRPTAVVTAGS